MSDTALTPSRATRSQVGQHCMDRPCIWWGQQGPRGARGMVALGNLTTTWWAEKSPIRENEEAAQVSCDLGEILFFF